MIIDFLNPSPISLAPWSGKTVDLPFKETLKWLPLPVWNSTPWAFNHRRNSLYFMCITRCFGRANVQHICYACNITVAPHIWNIASLRHQLATIALSPSLKLPSNPSLPIQRPGLRTRVRCRRTSAPTHVCRRFFVPAFRAMAAVRGRLSSLPGSCISGFSACA